MAQTATTTATHERADAASAPAADTLPVTTAATAQSDSELYTEQLCDFIAACQADRRAADKAEASLVATLRRLQNLCGRQLSFFDQCGHLAEFDATTLALMQTYLRQARTQHAVYVAARTSYENRREPNDHDR